MKLFQGGPGELPDVSVVLTDGQDVSVVAFSGQGLGDVTPQRLVHVGPVGLGPVGLLVGLVVVRQVAVRLGGGRRRRLIVVTPTRTALFTAADVLVPRLIFPPYVYIFGGKYL